MFGLSHPPTPEMFFRYFGNFGAEGRAFLKWLLNVLDDAEVTHIFKDKGKLDRVIKNHPIAHVKFCFSLKCSSFCKCCLWARTFLPFTRDCNNYRWLVKPEKKDQWRQIRLSWKTVEMNKLLIMPLKSLSFLAATTKEWHYDFDAFFSTRILKIDEQRFLYIDPSAQSNS